MKVHPSSQVDDCTAELKEQITVAAKWKEIQGSSDWEGLLAPLDDTLRAEIVRYGELAQACYDSFDSDPQSKYCGSCKYSKTKLFSKVGLVHCGYEVTKYLYATSQFPFMGALSLPVCQEKWSTQSNWMGYVAVCTSEAEIERLGRRDIVVCWRGTKTSTEWAEDFNDFLVSAESLVQTSHIATRDGGNIESDGGGDAVKVERGFLSVYTSRVEGSTSNDLSAREQLWKELQRLVNLYNGEEISITIVGHSLGGALAVLSAYDIAQRHLITTSSTDGKSTIKVVPITGFTFGCPRVGNRAFRDECKRLQVKILRVVNKNDIVPQVPGIFVNERLGMIMGRLLQWLPWTYFHVGVELTLDNNQSPYLRSTVNLHYRHNLETYLHLVDGYVGAAKCDQFRTHGRDPALVNKHTGLLDEQLHIPSNWWQEQNKGLGKNHKGWWIQPEREQEDQPHQCL